MPRSMFERYGGFVAVSRIVSAFYDRVLDSDLLADYFDGVDMRRLIDHQTKFISQVLGGPANYSYDQLRQVHAHLEITQEAFVEAMRLLRETLEEHGLTSDDVAVVMRDIEAYRPAIVAGGNG
jgi:hemoglobin